MSSQIGLFYYDQRAIADLEIDRLMDLFKLSDADATGEHRVSGLFMAHGAVWFDDFSASERQPFTSSCGTTITFDGRLDRRHDLLLQFRTALRGEKTDCALAAATYDRRKVEGLAALIGDWSMAISDPSSHSIILASDYAGARPLYYHANHERVLWSSYLNVLNQFTGITEVDDTFVAGFLSSGGSPCRTPFRDIYLVPAGQALRFSARGTDSSKLWELPTDSEIRYQNPRNYEEQLRDLFRESAQVRLRTNYPVCSDLSGGLDSSSVVCMAAHLINERAVEAPRIAGISFGPPGAPDEKFYKIVQRHCGIEHHYVNTDDFPYLSANYLTEASPAAWGPLWTELSRTAKQAGARTYFTGQGGDLIMGNWFDDSDQLARPLRQAQFKNAIKEAVRWSQVTRVPALTLLWRAMRSNLPHEWRLGPSYDLTSSPVIREQCGDSLTASFRAKSGLNHPDWIWSTCWQKAAPERRKLLKSVSQALESGGLFRPPERMQHLYFSHPYSHRPLVEFMLSIPPEIVCEPGTTRSLMRRAFAELLPPQVARRRSKAFFNDVFLVSVRPAAQALLADPQPLMVAERGYVQPDEVRQRLRRMTQSLSCNEHQLRQIVLLELWLRKRQGRALGLPGEAAYYAVAV